MTHISQKSGLTLLHLTFYSTSLILKDGLVIRLTGAELDTCQTLCNSTTLVSNSSNFTLIHQSRIGRISNSS